MLYYTAHPTTLPEEVVSETTENAPAVTVLDTYTLPGIDEHIASSIAAGRELKTKLGMALASMTFVFTVKSTARFPKGEGASVIVEIILDLRVNHISVMIIKGNGVPAVPTELSQSIAQTFAEHATGKNEIEVAFNGHNEFSFSF